jgi:hypothetical protein
LDCTLRILFATELDVHVANHMFANVLAHLHVFNASVALVDLGKQLFVKIVKKFLFLSVGLFDLKRKISSVLVLNNLLESKHPPDACRPPDCDRDS